MKKLMVFIAGALIAFALLFHLPARTTQAFQGPGCMGECADCHTLTSDEAAKLLKAERFKAQVKDVRMGPIKGLWEVEITQGERTFIVYMDFAKKFLIENPVFTSLEKLGEPPPLKKLDTSSIPLDNAIVIGNPEAKLKVVVFDDPDCPYCAKLHEDIKTIIKERKDIAFYIKMYPLPIHPEAYAKSKAIQCKKSAELLDDAFAGKKLPPPDCETDEVDKNIQLAKELGLAGTPAVVLPDGRLLPGYVPGDVLLDLIDNPK